ncbi:MAG: T9SS type A sorting domain-containing protein [Candidatus Azobacteroides sp.]|nr:T9SS type A sorting domain-containing protein [Candidatus Azobacteroides sp.]
MNTLDIKRCEDCPVSLVKDAGKILDKNKTMKSTLLFLFFFLFTTTSIVKAQSPYIHKVYAYRPAPGQFVNLLPEYEAGDTQVDMNRKAEESISGENKALISLGGYGGYVIFGFDHPIVNVSNVEDFKVWGNAMDGSAEPGVVMVSYDANGNGEPDDEWFELAGSEYNNLNTIKDYRIIYYKPIENPHESINNADQRWSDNQGAEGYIPRNAFHSQPYYPQWISDETLSFEGTKLTDNYVDESGNGSYYVLNAYPWGYADNYSNADERSNLNIEWAVDAAGNPVHLPAIHFVKVYTAVNQYCGWLGETSTEITGAEDLHPSAIISGIKQNEADQTFLLLNNPVKDQLIIASERKQNVYIYDCLGRKRTSFDVESGTNYISCSQLPQGIYVLVNGDQTIKFIKQ